MHYFAASARAFTHVTSEQKPKFFHSLSISLLDMLFWSVFCLSFTDNQTSNAQTEQKKIRKMWIDWETVREGARVRDDIQSAERRKTEE